MWGCGASGRTRGPWEGNQVRRGHWWEKGGEAPELGDLEQTPLFLRPLGVSSPTLLAERRLAEQKGQLQASEHQGFFLEPSQGCSRLLPARHWDEREEHHVLSALGTEGNDLARGTQCSARNQMENGLVVQMILSVWGCRERSWNVPSKGRRPGGAWRRGDRDGFLGKKPLEIGRAAQGRFPEMGGGRKEEIGSR